MNPIPNPALPEVNSKDPTVSIVPPNPNNSAPLGSSSVSSGPPTPAQGNPGSSLGDGSNLERRGRFTIKNVSRVNADESKSDTVTAPADKQDKQQNSSLNNSSPVTATSVNPVISTEPIVPDINSVKETKEKLEVPSTCANSNLNSLSLSVEETSKPKEDEQKVKKKSRFTVKAVTVEEEMMPVTQNPTPSVSTNTNHFPSSSSSTNTPSTIANNKSAANLLEGGINIRPPSVVIPGGDTIQSTEQMKLERLLEMNYQIMAQISDIMKTNRGSQTANLSSVVNSSSAVSTPSVHQVTTQSIATIVAPMPSRNGGVPNRNNNNNVPSRPPSSQSLTSRDEINQTVKNPVAANHNDNISTNHSSVSNPSPNTTTQINNRHSQHSDPQGPNGATNNTAPITSAANKSTASSNAGNNNGTNATASNNAPPSSSSNLSEEKDKGYGKMSYYLNEMKKELENEKSNKRDKAIEQQRLREKCSQFEELYHIEQQKFQTLQEKHEKLKNNYKTLEIQYHDQQLQLIAALQKIEELNHANFALHQQITPISSILSPFPTTNFASPTEFSHSTSSNLMTSSMSIDITSEKVATPSNISPVNSSHFVHSHSGLHQSRSSHSNIAKGVPNDETVQVQSQSGNSSSSSTSQKSLLPKSSKQDLFENYISSTASSPNNHIHPNISPPNSSTATASQTNPSSTSGKAAGGNGVGNSSNIRNTGNYTQFVEGNILNENVNLLVHIAKEFSDTHRNSPALNINPGGTVNGNPMTSGQFIAPASSSTGALPNNSIAALASNNGGPIIK